MSKEKTLANEQEIIKACIDNNPKAQKLLFETHSGKMLGVCRRYCQNLDDAKDAMHEGFIKVFSQIHKFKGDSKLETWITRIMIFTAIDHFKKSIKYNYYEDDEEIYRVSGQNEVEEIEYEEEKIKMSDLYHIIGQLPAGYRMVFSLYAIDGYSHKEISAELGITEGTSKSQLARARKMLQSLVKEKLDLG